MSDEITSTPTLTANPSPAAPPTDAEKRFANAARLLKVAPSKLAELEASHGRIGIVLSEEAGDWAVAVRRPTRKEYKRFKANANNPAKQSDAQEALFVATCLLPEGGVNAIDALLNGWPGIPEAFANSLVLSRLSGMAGHEEPNYEIAANTLKVPVQALLNLEAKYGRIGVVLSDDPGEWGVVVRRPTRQEYKLYRANSNNPQKAPDAREALFLATCVIPDGPTMSEPLLEAWPGIPEACAVAGTFGRLAGMTGAEGGKA